MNHGLLQNAILNAIDAHAFAWCMDEFVWPDNHCFVAQQLYAEAVGLA